MALDFLLTIQTLYLQEGVKQGTVPLFLDLEFKEFECVFLFISLFFI
jgi:hypothetical protein